MKSLGVTDRERQCSNSILDPFPGWDRQEQNSPVMHQYKTMRLRPTKPDYWHWVNHQIMSNRNNVRRVVLQFHLVSSFQLLRNHARRKMVPYYLERRWRIDRSKKLSLEGRCGRLIGYPVWWFGLEKISLCCGLPKTSCRLEAVSIVTPDVGGKHTILIRWAGVVEFVGERQVVGDTVRTYKGVCALRCRAIDIIREWPKVPWVWRKKGSI